MSDFTSSLYVQDAQGQYQLANEEVIIERAKRLLESRMSCQGTSFNSPQAARDYLALNLGNLPYEVFGVLFLDSQNRMIAFEKMFRGTLNQTSVYPREVVIQALHHRSAAVILTHNHPSGSLQPSRADEALTKNLKAALALVDVRILDHIIVAGSRSLSMAEQGLV